MRSNPDIYIKKQHIRPEAAVRAMAGFTLIELAIALLILGLIAGSIAVTRNLVRASQVQSVVSQLQQFSMAASRFTEEFRALPGDISDIREHWNAANVDDGDGNGFIGGVLSGNAAPSEPYQFWLHLQLAGFLPLNMTGSNNGAGIGVVPGVNVPAGEVSHSAWFVGYDLAVVPESYLTEPDHYFLFGGVQANGLPTAPILTPDEAYSIDLKADNGEPGTGRILALHFNQACSEAESGSHVASNTNARYRLEDSTRRCALAFNHAF